jgi:hypothetical protein
VSERIRAGSKFKRFLFFLLIDVSCFSVPLTMSSLTPGGMRTSYLRPLFYSISSKMVDRSSALHAGHSLPTGTFLIFSSVTGNRSDRLCGLVVRVPGYRSRGPGSIPGATRFSEK